MALFKISKGNNSALLTDSSATGYKTPTDGYAWYDTSSRLFYIDAEYNSGTVSRIPINANNALNGVYYGTCSTAAATKAKVAILNNPSGFKLLTGTMVIIKFTNASAKATMSLKLQDDTSGTAVDISEAKNLKLYGTSDMSDGTTTSGWRAGATVPFVYDGTNWVRFYWENSTYYYTSAYCTTAAATAAKVAAHSGGQGFDSGKYFQIWIQNSNTSANALTLNINSKGAKKIYINGEPSSSTNYTLPAGCYLVYYDAAGDNGNGCYHFRTDSKMPGNLAGNADTATSATSATNATNDSDGNPINSTYLKLSGGTMTGGITFPNDTSAHNDKGILFANGSRIGESSAGMGIYGAGNIYLRPNAGSAAGTDGVEISTSGLFPTNNNSENLGDSSHKWANVYATTFNGALSGNASSATEFSAAKSVTLTGDVTGTASSKAGWSIATTLANTAVTAGAYGNTTQQTPGYNETFTIPYFTVDSKGRLTAAGTTTVKLPASDNTDTKVTQTAITATTSADYRILLSKSTNDTTETDTVNKNTDLRFNTGTKVLSVGGSITATGDLTLTGDAYLNNQTYAESLTANSLLVNGNANFVQIPTAPTPATNSNDTSIATTAFVKNNIGGLSGAMHFRGTTTTALTDGTTTAAVTIGGSSYTPQAGDVVLYSNKEFVWTGSLWEILGDEGSYKVKQTAVSSPTASGNAVAYIDTISQNANGDITATKKTIPDASTSVKGILQFTEANTNAQLNALSTGSSDPQDNDYFISQYVNGGSTTTTYHRRPVSKLYNYINTKLNITNNNISVGWNTETTIATIGGTAIKIKIPANPNTNTTYTFADGTDGSFSVTPSGGTAQVVDIGKPATAGTADQLGTTTVGSSHNPIYLNSGTPTTTVGNTIEYIVGTQTSDTNVWLGATSDSALYTGKMIAYKLPKAGNSSAATLNLTLADGTTTTGAIAVKRKGSGNTTTHYSAGEVIFMAYDGTYWQVNADYDSNSNDTSTTYARYNHGAFAPITALYRYELLFSHPTNTSKVIPANTTSNSTGTTKTTITTEAFNPYDYIFWYSTTGTVDANTNIGVSYLWYAYSLVDIRYSFNTGTTLTANKDVYLVLQMQSDGTAKLRNPGAIDSNASAQATGANAGPVTQIIPTSEDGFVYLKLGHAYDTYRIALTWDHPMYWYKNSAFRPYTQGRGISNITRSETTFTATRDDGTTFTFDQQDNNTTYTFTSGTNGFSVTPSGGTAQTVTVTPSITNNVTGSGTSGYLAKFNGTNTITNGPAIGTSTTTFLRNDGTWDTPVDTKVVQTAKTDNVNYKILATASASPTSGNAAEAIYDVDITINPSTNTITATNFAGNASSASKLGSATVGSTTKPIYLSSGTATECSTYAGGTAVTLNNSSKAGSTASFYAPTAGGTQNTQALVGDGATAAPKWVNISPSISITAGTSSAAPKVNVTVLGQSGTAQSITTASTSAYGVTKLNSATNSTSTTEAATPSAVKAAYDVATGHKYWADVEATSAAAYNKAPEMATIKLNGNTSASAASTSNVTLVFDATLQALNFVFA